MDYSQWVWCRSIFLTLTIWLSKVDSAKLIYPLILLTKWGLKTYQYVKFFEGQVHHFAPPVIILWLLLITQMLLYLL